MSILQPDPYWSYVKLLCHFDGPDSSTRIVEEKHKAATLTGNAKISTLQSKIGGSSAYFDGVGDAVSFPSSADFNLGVLDFTFEGWVQPRTTANANPCIFSTGSNFSDSCVWLVADGSATPLKYSFFVFAISGSVPHLVSASDVVYDQWTHIAVTRSNTTWRLFINGVLEATSTSAISVGSSNVGFNFSNPSLPANQYFGYIDEFRATVGYCRYTTNFTPSTERFPDYRTTTTDPHFDKVKLLCHFDGENGSTTFVDQKGHTLTPKTNSTPPSISNATNSYVFGGTGMSLPPAAFAYLESVSGDYTLGTQDFTIECFYRSLSGATNANSDIFALQNSVGGYALRFSTNPYNLSFTISVNGTNVANNVYGNIVSTGAQRHLALVRNGNAMYVFSGGVRYGPYALTAGTSIDSNGVFRLGNSPSAPHSDGSVIDEFRYTVGVARYAIAFTPPTEPFSDFGLQKLTGTVLDPAGNPVARTVRSYRSSDGLLIDTAVSSAVDGGFALRATDTTEHFVVVQDATKNALVYDHIVPVI